MNISKSKKLPSLEELIKKHGSIDELKLKVADDRKEIQDILSGKDKRKLVIVGPCSAWPAPAVISFAEKLSKVSEKLKDKIKIVIRLYVQKPRTALGWLGPMIQPDPFAPADIEAGIHSTWDMMIKVLNLGLPIASEIVFSSSANYLEDFCSWIAIGARNAESQEHRILASALSCPIGMKNPTCGCIAAAVNAVLTAQHAHLMIMGDQFLQTNGNQFAHLVLRGGNLKPNYSLCHLQRAIRLMQKHNIKNPAIIVDASHGNSIFNGKKDCRRQIDVVKEVTAAIKKSAVLNGNVKGFMLESFIKGGSQKIGDPSGVDLSGLSITDPCLSWEQTEELLYYISKMY